MRDSGGEFGDLEAGPPSAGAEGERAAEIALRETERIMALTPRAAEAVAELYGLLARADAGTRPCSAGCGLAAAPGDIYCQGCATAPALGR